MKPGESAGFSPLGRYQRGGGGGGGCRGGAIRVRVDSVRDGVLLAHVQWTHAATTNPVIDVGVFLPRFEQRQVLAVFRCFLSGLWGHFIDKVVDVPVVTRFGCFFRLVEEFHIFSTCSRCSHDFSYVISTSSLYLAATCACALRQSMETLGQISYVFQVKVGSELPAQFSLGNLNIISVSSIWESLCASVCGAFGRISVFSS